MTTIPALIERYIDAYNAMDIGAMLAMMPENIHFRSIVDGATYAQAHGKLEFSQMATFAISAFKWRRQVITHAITVADHTLIEVDYFGEPAMDLPNGWKAGQEIAFKGRSSFRISGQHITQIIDQS
ncbi:hypothetical protein BFP70_06425 [Thioclava sp. SK-1]|uniref:nuclear transport factor 2 family protein n=1 Tax=Thioclava sp. SK-1 TaxID=1889770 RepID=UPI000824CDBF|nr:nuclear transport factor 2 family protein [Thioclava sp. SK-1]OCX65776.1 hypothetical protein BFP70_06425 [Thioclava sp. SK-1]